MSESQLRFQLEQLREEVALTKGLSSERRDELLRLISDIELQVHSEGDGNSLREQTDAIVNEFDISHPTLAAVIKRVMETLANIGV